MNSCPCKYIVRHAIMGALALQALIVSNASAETITLDGPNMGYYWYEKSSWMGGSDTSKDFAYGNAQGIQQVQTNYQYYGGADRFWQQKDLYFQIDLTSITGDLGQAVFYFYVTANTSPVSSTLKHVDVQTTAATGDASQKLAGTTVVAATDAFVVGWNSLDVTSFIQSDLSKGHAFAAFSIPKFGQVQDQNRLLSMYGPTSTTLVEGLSTQPHLEYTTTPEPSSLLLLGLGGLGLMGRRRTA